MFQVLQMHLDEIDVGNLHSFRLNATSHCRSPFLIENPDGIELEGPNTVPGSERGTNALRGAGSVTIITLVPKGILGNSYSPAWHLLKCAAARTAIPHHVVGRRAPASKKRAPRFSAPTVVSAGLPFGSYPQVVVLRMP